MKILITQSELSRPPFFFAHDGLERSWYDLFAGHQLIPAPNIPTTDWSQIEFDCLVISGGNDSIDRHLTEDILYRLALDQNKLIVGVCHGAFVVNDLAAGINGRIDNHIGIDHTIFMGGQTFVVNSFHSQYIAQLAPGFEIVAQDSLENPEAFKHIFLPIWGIVWHPERMTRPVLPATLADILRTDKSKF